MAESVCLFVTGEYNHAILHSVFFILLTTGALIFPILVTNVLIVTQRNLAFYSKFKLGNLYDCNESGHSQKNRFRYLFALKNENNRCKSYSDGK